MSYQQQQQQQQQQKCVIKLQEPSSRFRLSWSAPPKIRLGIEAGRQSCKLTWSELAEYIKDSHGPVSEWFVYHGKKGGNPTETKRNKFEVMTKDYFLEDLDGSTTYEVKLTWIKSREPTYQGPDRFHQYYLDDKFACTYAEFTTLPGIRIQAAKGFIDKTFQTWTECRDEICAYGARKETFNILIYGGTGCGKSSFINTLRTAFSSDKFIKTDMPNSQDTTRDGHSHVTREFSRRDTLTGDSINIYDLWGSSDSNFKDKQLTAILEGKIKPNWQRTWPYPDVDNLHPEFINAKPKMRDRMHAVIFLLPAPDLHIEADPQNPYYIRLNSLMEECLAQGILPIICLSKVDQLDEKLKGDGFKSVFSSERIATIYDRILVCFGFGLTRVFPCEFYTSEHNRNIYMEIAVMQCLLEALKKASEWKKQLATRLDKTVKPLTKEDRYFEALETQGYSELKRSVYQESKSVSITVSKPQESKSVSIPIPTRQETTDLAPRAREIPRTTNPIPDGDDDDDYSTQQEVEVRKEGQLAPPEMKTDPRSWSVDRVGEWLQEGGLEQYVDAFAKEKIDGATLLKLNDEGLKELGLEKAVTRSRFFAKQEQLLKYDSQQQ